MKDTKIFHGTITESGEKYSYRFFKDYTKRGKVHIKTHEGHAHHLDFYTTEDNKKNAEDFLRNQASEKVKDLRIFYWTTKQADDIALQFIEKLK